MAYPSNVAVVFFVVTLATPLATGYVLNGVSIAETRISGRYVCSPTGSPVPGSPSSGLAGVPVALVCNGRQTAQTVTNATGYYEASLDTTQDIYFEPSYCSTLVQLPVDDCNLLPKNGTLQSPISLVEIVESAIGAIASFVAGLIGLCFNESCSHY